jgi:hypothetical protein
MRKNILFFTMLALATTAFSAKNRWQLDSIVENDIVNNCYYKHEYTYDNKGNLISDVRWGSSNGNDWSEMIKYEYTYDCIGNKSSRTYYVNGWEGGLKKWKANDKVEYDYVNNNETFFTHYGGWGSDCISRLNDWEKYSKIEYTYNNNNRTLEVFYRWSNELNDWKIGSKTEYTYDKKGNEILKIWYNWLNDEWKVNEKNVTSYNRKGNKILYVVHFWDKEQSDWRLSSKEKYAYDSNSNQTLIYSWDKEQNNWRTFPKKLENTYDNNGNLASYSRYYWNTKEDKWIQTTTTYYYSFVSTSK